MSSLYDSCCCQEWEIQNVADKGWGNWQFTVSDPECDFCDCVSPGDQINFYDDVGDYIGSGIILTCEGEADEKVVNISGMSGHPENGCTIKPDVCDSLLESSIISSTINSGYSSIESNLYSSLTSSQYSSLSSLCDDDCCLPFEILFVDGVGTYAEVGRSACRDIVKCMPTYGLYINVYNDSGFMGQYEIWMYGGLVDKDWFILKAGPGVDITGATYFVYASCDSSSIESVISSIESLQSEMSSLGSLSTQSLSSLLTSSLNSSQGISSLYSSYMSGLSSVISSINSEIMSSILSSVYSSLCSGSEVGLFSIYKTACYKYRFDSDECDAFKISVIDYITKEAATDKNGNVLTNYDMVEGQIIEFPHEMAMYQVTITCNGHCVSECRIIYEYCDLITCYKYLDNYIKCEANNPCEEPCDKEVAKKKELYRLSLNEMITMLGRLFGLMHGDKLRYLTSYGELESERILLLNDISDVFDKIKEIVLRCGCSNTITSTNKTQCT